MRKNKVNPQNMAKEIWAILDHYASTVDQSKQNMINAQKEKIVGARTKEMFQLIKEHINLKSGHSQRQLLLMYCTPYLFGLKMKVSWTGTSKGILKIRTFNSLFWSFSPKEQYNLPLGTSHSNSLAVCLYNSSMEYTISRLLKQANMEVDKNLKRQWQLIEEER